VARDSAVKIFESNLICARDLCPDHSLLLQHFSMALRILTQARLALRPATTTTLRVALAQRAAQVPLPGECFDKPHLSPIQHYAAQCYTARAFSISRPWLAAEAVKTQPALASDATIEKPAPIEKKSDENQVPFSSIKDLISPETYEAITYKPHKLTHMTPVQAAVLPLIPQLTKHHSELKPGPDGQLPPRDMLVRAKTGTGKTLAFLVPAIEARVAAIEHAKKEALEKAGLTSDRMYEARAARAYTRQDAGTLIISPTRELATQIANEALKLTMHHDGFEVRLFVGGNSKREQMRGWMRGRRDIVVATPGRLRDLLQSEPSISEGLKNTQMVGHLIGRFHASNTYLSSSSTKLILSLTWASAMTLRTLFPTSLNLLNAKPCSTLRQFLAPSNKSLVPLSTIIICLSVPYRKKTLLFILTFPNIILWSLGLKTNSLTFSAFSHTTSSQTRARAKLLYFSLPPR
jgi:hypothetical protein